jgi:hypothetical protein
MSTAVGAQINFRDLSPYLHPEVTMEIEKTKLHNSQQWSKAKLSNCNGEVTVASKEE